MSDWGGIQHFRRSEFGRHGDVEPDRTLVARLDEMRGLLGAPIAITSGIRAPRHDGDNSAHITGHAADLRCATSRMRYAMVCAALDAGFRRIGVYDKHIHVDTDPTKLQDVIWQGVSQ